LGSLLCCSGAARLAPFHVVRSSMAFFKQFIYLLPQPSPAKAAHRLGNPCVGANKPNRHQLPLGFPSRSIATLRPPFVIDAVMSSHFVRGTRMPCHCWQSHSHSLVLTLALNLSQMWARIGLETLHSHSYPLALVCTHIRSCSQDPKLT